MGMKKLHAYGSFAIGQQLAAQFAKQAVSQLERHEISQQAVGQFVQQPVAQITSNALGNLKGGDG